MNYLIMVLICFSSCYAYAQNTIYFNKTFNLDTLNSAVGNCAVLQDGYLFTGNWRWNDNNETQRGFVAIKTDFWGNVQASKHLYGHIGFSFITAGGDVTTTSDGNYLLVGTITHDYVSENEDLILIKYNETGDTIWRNIIQKPTTVEQCFNVLATRDGGYIIAGRQRNFSQNGRFFVLKTDSLGNEEWSYQYHPQQHGLAGSIVETDTGYVVSGAVQFPDTDTDMLIMEIDKQGYVIWEKNYGGGEGDNACLVIPKNNTFFLASAVRENNTPHPFIAQIDSIGDTLWTRIFDVAVVAVQEAPLQPTPDGGFVGLYGYATEFGYDAPWFWRFTASGDTLWTRRIPGAATNHNTYLKDIAPTHDGGWVLSGFDYSEQSSWVVKLDSLGYTCSYLGCDSTSVIDALPEVLPPSTSQAGFSLAPNPAHDLATIYLSQATTQNQRVDLFDVSGRLVKTFVLPNFATTYTFSVADLPVGVYVCRIKGIEQVQKLVILK